MGLMLHVIALIHNLSVYGRKLWRIFVHPRKYLVFKKSDHKFNWLFWTRRSWDSLFYLEGCDEERTVQSILPAIYTGFNSTERILNQFLADFVVNLFVTTANSTSIVRDDAFQCNQYELYAQSALEARKSSGRPLLGQYTPDLYIIYDPARPEETKIIIDAVDTKNADQAFSEKENTYSALCDVLYVVVGNGDGSFEVRRSKSVDRAVADRTARFFESVFGLCLVNKLTQHKVDQRAQFHQEYAVLRRELQYWSHCKVLKRIVRTRR